MQLDLLAFAAHPDDVELACSGIVMLHQQQGHRVGIVDLTEGELGTRGSVPQRREESARASQIMKLDARENLGLHDGWFTLGDEEKLAVIRAVRKYRPKVVLANALEDRHPDHGRAAQLVIDACFLAGLKQIKTEVDGEPQEAWRPQRMYHYIQDRPMKPNLVVDISAVWELKKQAIAAYSSQFFNPDSPEPITYIATEAFSKLLEARAREYGHMIGAEYGEGLVITTPQPVRNLLEHLPDLV